MSQTSGVKGGPISDRSLARALRMMKGEILPGRPDPAGRQAMAEAVFPGEDVSDPSFIRWLYEENPVHPAYELITRSGGIVSGHIAGVPLRYRLAGKDVLGGIAVNAITHPEHRGRGIFIVLHAEVSKITAARDILFLFGFANPNSEKGCLRHLHYHDLGRFPLWVLPLRWGRIAAAQESLPRFLRRPVGAAGAPFVALWRMARRPLGGRGIGVEKVAAIGPEFDGLWAEAGKDYTNIAVRDAKFLEWRFAKAPTRRYDIFVARAAGRLAGYLVGTTTHFGGLRWAMIADLLVPASAEGRVAAARLVAAFTRHARAAGAAVAGCLMLRHAPAAAALRKNGYLIAPPRLMPREFPILLQWNAPQAPPDGVFDVRNWYLTMGDYDAV
jgi:GNAT superfamily N-acetyltransferase